MTPVDQIRNIVDVWLATDFEGGRHARRVAKIAAIERGEDPATIVSEISDASTG